MTFTRKSSKAAPAAPAAPERTAGDGPPNFEALFQQHWERVCAVLFRLVGDRDEAEDLAVDTFLRLYHRPPNSPDSLGGWLYRVATNLGFNALRARRRRQRYEEEAGTQALAEALSGDNSWDPAALFEQAQERDAVRAALERMKPRSAQLLILRHSGLSYAEIAQALDITPTSVGSLLARAEREFEQLFEAT